MDFSKDLVNALNEIVIDTKWQNIGKVLDFEYQKHIRLYPDVNDDEIAVQLDDIVVFKIGEDSFYGIDCSCPHEGISLIFSLHKFKFYNNFRFIIPLY